MNIPKNFVIQENGIIFFSNLMPTNYGIHSSISEAGTATVERITNCHALWKQNEAHKKKQRFFLIFIRIISLFLFALFSFKHIWIMMPIPYFLMIALDESISLCQKFFEVRKKRHPFELAFAIVNVLKTDKIPCSEILDPVIKKITTYDAELCASIFFFLQSNFITLVMAFDNSRPLSLLGWFFSILLIFSISSLASFVFLIGIAQHLQGFFVLQPSEIDFQVVLEGLEEWNKLEEELRKHPFIVIS